MSKRRLKICEAEQCGNSSSNCDLTFFKMTKDSVRWRLWSSCIKMKDNKRVSNFLCSDHFPMSAFTDTLKRNLIKYALPTIQVKKDSLTSVGEIATSEKHNIDSDFDPFRMNKRLCPEVRENEFNSSIDVNSPSSNIETITNSSNYSRGKEIWSVLNQLKARNAKESSFKEIISFTHRSIQEVSCEESISNCNQRISEVSSKCNNNEEAKISFLCTNVKNDLLKSQAKLFECTQQVFNLENAVRKKQDELEALKEKLEAKEQQCDSYFKQIEELNFHLKSRTNDFRLQNQKLKKLKGENSSLKNKLIRLKNESYKISFLKNYCSKLEKKLKVKHIFENKRQIIALKRIERLTTIPDEKEKEKLLTDFLKDIEEKNKFFSVLDLQPKISVNKEMTDKLLCQLDSSQNISDVSYPEQSYAHNEGEVQQPMFYNDLSNNICLTSTASKNHDIPFHPNYLDNISHAFSKPVDKSHALTHIYKLKENMALPYNVLCSNENFTLNSNTSNMQHCFPNNTNENPSERENTCNISCNSDDMIVLDSNSNSEDVQTLQDENIDISTKNPSSSSLDMRNLPKSSEDVYLKSMIPVKVKYKFESHSEANCVLWLPTHPVSLLTGGAEKTFKHWSVYNTNISKNEYSCSTYPILTLDADAKRTLIALSCGLTSQVWDISEFKRKHSFIGHKQKVMASKFLKPEHTVVTASLDRTIRLWSLDHGNCIATFKNESEVHDVESKNANLVIGGHSNGIISFWDIRASNKIAEIVTSSSITSLNLSKTGTTLLSSLQDQGLKIYDLRIFKESSSFIADEFSVGCDWTRAKFSPDDQYCCCGSKNGSVFIWNVNSNTIERELIAHSFNVPSCCWSICGSYFASCDSKGHCIIWSNK